MRKQKELLTTIRVKPFEHDLIFFYGEKETNLLKHLNKNKKIAKYLKKNLGDFLLEDDGAGSVHYNPESNDPFLLYINIPKKKDWYFYETIMHECLHIVDNLSKARAFTNEKEFRAYLLESIFRDVRKYIQFNL